VCVLLIIGQTCIAGRRWPTARRKKDRRGQPPGTRGKSFRKGLTQIKQRRTPIKSQRKYGHHKSFPGGPEGPGESFHRGTLNQGGEKEKGRQVGRQVGGSRLEEFGSRKYLRVFNQRKGEEVGSTGERKKSSRLPHLEWGNNER